MIGEIMCHLTGWTGLPFEIIFLLIGIIWFTAGWLINGIRLNRKWIKNLDILDEEYKKRVIEHAYTQRKREKSSNQIKEL